ANRFIVGRQGTGQADALIYGRYNEHLLAPLLAVAAASLLRRRIRWRQVAAWSAAVLAVLAACGGLLVVGRSAAALRAPIVFVNVFGLQPALHRAGRIDVLAITAGALAGAVLLLALATRPRPAFLAVAVTAAGLASASFSAVSMVKDSRQRAGQRVVIHAVALVDRLGGAPSCIGYDLPIGAEWVVANDQTFLPTEQFRPFDSRSGQAPCSDLVLTPRLDLDRTYPGARLMAAENYAPTYLWVLPGRTLDRLAAAGVLLPTGYPGPLPGGAYASRLALAGAPPTTAGPGQSVPIRLAVTNRGRGAPWPSQRGFTSGDGWVSIVAAWTPAGETTPPLTALSGPAQRYQLARELWPSETVVETLSVQASIAGRPLAPGRYQLTVGLVQDGVSYFVAHRDPPLRLLVDVR
ncbi:MAG TPA: hypothetical protein VGI06_11560, partial [Acidimicrobiales bacterium]